jgi:sugar phosphate isomerase/epimerase
MRIGFLSNANLAELDWAREHGFGSFGWVAFESSPAAQPDADWRSAAQQVADAARERGLRISAIGALYRNPLDPQQTERARAVFTRAIEVAGHIGVRTVAGFAGMPLDITTHERGGNPVYQASEKHLPALLAFWEPLAAFAAERGVRIAFEHCPQGAFHLPAMHYNFFGQPALWEKFFDASSCANLGLEWDASHLVCQFIDPVENLRRFGSRVFHVHAKDARINRHLLAQYGPCHPGVAEHCWPGLGDSNWPAIVSELLRAGYDSDLNLEGWHDPVYRDHAPDAANDRLAGQQLEATGRLLAQRWLEPLVPREVCGKFSARSSNII